MTKEKKFTDETFEENVAKGMNWMQGANSKLVEAQQQQMKTASDMFNNALDSSKMNGGNNLNNSIGAPGKAMAELFQKNMSRVTEFFKTEMKQVKEFTVFSDKESLTNEMKKKMESFNSLVSDLAKVNQTNLDTILKQFDTIVKSFTPVNEQLKKEMEAAVESSKETMQKIVESYSSITVPYFEGNKETYEKFNDQIKASIQENIKFWSEFMNPGVSADTKTAETKVEKELIKVATDGIGKKHVVNLNHDHKS